MMTPLKAETIAHIDQLLVKYPQPRSALLMILHAIQEELGAISADMMEWVAQKMGLTPIEVYEVMTFYPMFRSQPTGTYHIKVCRTLSCALAGSYKVCEALQEKLNCKLNETSADGHFTIEFVECLASCGTAPVVMVNDKLHENIKPERVEDWVNQQFSTSS